MVATIPTLKVPQLRPYQIRLVNDLYSKLSRGYKKIAIIAGTGAGKTIISAQICAHAESASKKLMFLVHLDVLVGQTYEKMRAFGLSCGFIKAGREENRRAPIQIASVQSMANRNWWRYWPADIVFYDEAHTTLFSQVAQSVLYESHPNAIHLAMTATPERLGKEQLAQHLQTYVASPVPRDLQQMGFLSKMKYLALPYDHNGADLEGERRDCKSPQRIKQIVREWKRLTPDKRTIAFCVDTEHARRTAEAFKAAGIPSVNVEGGTPIKERTQLYADLKTGKLLVLTSCNVISIGFDEPSVEVGLLLRPTQSSALHHQQIGRIMRISPQTGKRYGIIIDQAGNLSRLGFPEDIESYYLPSTAA